MLALMSIEQTAPIIKSSLPTRRDNHKVHQYVTQLSNRLSIPKSGSNGSMKSLETYLNQVEQTIEVPAL